MGSLKKSKKISSVRLSKNVIPERYRISLKPDFETFTFSGEETIFFKLASATKSITLHARDLSISQVAITARTKTGKDVLAGKIAYDVKAETATFTFRKTIAAGKHELSLLFKGVLNETMKGFYKSTYEHKGQTKHLATTQFEATDARKAFPCFDEPAQKAVFDVTLMIPAHMTAVSNTIETAVTEHESGIKVVKFAPTPKMSTYLLAFIIGELESIEGKTKDGTVVRIFTTPGKSKRGQFALETAIRTLEFYNKYFNIKYPLPILDMIAIPDFAASAMENWGAVTYRETSLLSDEKDTPLINKQYIAQVIAHELAHQWFGNLVTMEWWTHLWLNESFATYIAAVATNNLFPDWHVWSEFITDEMGNSLDLDSLKTTHPIEIEVHHPDQIDEIFDGISYGKGASVIRMLADYLGEKDFRDGLRYYLKKHSYKNTSTIHLWEAFEKISKKPVRKMMGVWTSQPGHPVLTVSSTEQQTTIVQSRYFSSPITKQSTNDTSIWPIPIKILTLRSARASYQYMTSRKLTLPHHKRGIKINADEVGFYRTAYHQQALTDLAPAIKQRTILQNDRFGIMRDCTALVASGENTIEDFFTLLNYYRHETSYNVWIDIISGLGELDVLMAHQPVQKKLRAFILEFLKPISKTVNWTPKKGESNNTSLLRSLILSALGAYGHQPTIIKARSVFKRAQKGKAIHPDIRAVVYNIVAKNGGPTEFNTLLKMYRTSELQEEKNRIGRALLLFPQTSLIKKAIAFTFSKEVRLQDAPLSYISAWRNQSAWTHLWNYMNTHWDKLMKEHGQGGRMLAYMIKPLAHFSDPQVAKDIEKFLNTYPVPSGEMAAQQTVERLKARVYRRKRDLPQIIAYFSDFKL